MLGVDKAEGIGLLVWTLWCLYARAGFSGMAELQGFFLFCRDDCQQALEMAKAWREADEQVVQEMQLKQQQQQQERKQEHQQQQENQEQTQQLHPMRKEQQTQPQATQQQKQQQPQMTQQHEQPRQS